MALTSHCVSTNRSNLTKALDTGCQYCKIGDTVFSNYCKGKAVTNRVLGVVHLPPEIDEKLRVEAYNNNIKFPDLLYEYIKLGMKAKREKEKERK